MAADQASPSISIPTVLTVVAAMAVLAWLLDSRIEKPTEPDEPADTVAPMVWDLLTEARTITYNAAEGRHGLG